MAGELENGNGVPEQRPLNKVEVVTLPNGQKAEAVFFYVGIDGIKCPFKGSIVSPLRGDKKDGVKVAYCINPTIVKAAKTSRVSGLMVVKCCSAVPENKWNPNDETRDCTLG